MDESAGAVPGRTPAARDRPAAAECREIRQQRVDGVVAFTPIGVQRAPADVIQIGACPGDERPHAGHGRHLAIEQYGSGITIGLKQPQHERGQIVVSVARRSDGGRLLVRRQIGHVVEDRLRAPPDRAVHPCQCRRSSPASQARATRQSRITVASETPRT